jgi:hypothetical protein
MAIPLSPENDLTLLATIKQVNPTTGALEPATTGTTQAFIATSNGPTATEADASLVASGTHTTNGVWLLNFDATTLDFTLLNGLFASATPWLIVTHSSGVRVYAELAYTPARAAAVV